jgi:N-acetylmuramic acid 6-phosphate (MurNAc-6-P) etherase
MQSVVYGGATGGIFSVLQSIGARAAFPVAYNVVAGAIGAGAAAIATADGGNEDTKIDFLGDIGDDGDDA